MARVVPLIAVLCTGIALGALLVAAASSSRSHDLPAEALPPLDPIAATTEIAELREGRGSVLAGTSLAVGEEPGEFSAALASHSGTELPVDNKETLVDLLRRTAREYEEHAQKYETRQRYSEADELRKLGEETRQIARRLTHEVQAEATLPDDSLRR